jgi:epoxyqueuosine reductase
LADLYSLIDGNCGISSGKDCEQGRRQKDEHSVGCRFVRAGDFPFPAWLDPSWHNCLVGCLHCQRVCPQNKDFLEWVEEGAEFSQEETALILDGVPSDQLPASTVRKLEQLDLIEYLDGLPRNLSALFHRVRNNHQFQ